MDARTASRTRDEIRRLSLTGLDSWTFRRRAIQILKRVLPVDAIWFATADPTTLLFTGSFVEEIPEELSTAFVTNEFLQDDVNKWTTLVRRGNAVSLYQATHGQPTTSARYRDILAPLGLGDELRLALKDGRACWGYVCLHREKGVAGFRQDEIDFLATVGRALARGLRSGLLVESVEEAHLTGPGSLVLTDDLSLVASTRPAEQWLQQIEDQPNREPLPQAIYALVRRLQEVESAFGGQATVSPSVRIRTMAGRWLVAHALRMSGPEASGHVSVILEPAGAENVAPILLQAYGLTRREVEVAQEVLRGHATDEIADLLSISTLTVQQHLKAVFDKTGIRSRRELSARVLYDQYVPRMLAGSIPALDGGFITSPDVSR